MSLVCIILDSQPESLVRSGSARSLLGMPLGCGTVLSHLAESVSEAGCSVLRILPTFDYDNDYAASVLKSAPTGSSVVGHNVLTSLVHEHEASDHVLIIDPRHWPVGGLDIPGILREASGGRWAVHGVAVASAPDGTQEYVHCDESGRVTRISRYYQGVTCGKIDAVVQSLLPLTSALDGVRLDSLAKLRAGLSVRRVLSRDIPVVSSIIDLTDPSGLLAINEQYAVNTVSGGAVRGFTEIRSGVIAGSGCAVHPDARLVGPVIIQNGVRIEEGATIVGPSVVGERCTIRSGALVAQSVLLADCVVGKDAVIRQRVVCDSCQTDSVEVLRPDRARPIDFGLARNQMMMGAGTAVTAGIRTDLAFYSAFKRVVDGLVAGVSLVVLAPLFLLTAIAIKLDSRGPVFFGHVREGRNGRSFRCLKFRTMCADADLRQRELSEENAVDGPQFKMDNDPRVTRVGNWLRASNIDELPQLINVLIGQMSIVGPRPSPFRENQICVPWRRARLSVRPGITGLWQICRDQRSEGDFHQWITYDIMYVRNLSLWTDMKILIATVVTLGAMWSVPYEWIVGEESTAQGGGATQQSDPETAVATPAG